MNYLLHLLIYFNIYAIVALSLNLVVGYCGMLTLAHAGFYGVGAYSYALVTLKFGWGFVPAAFFAMLVASVLSLTLSLPSWRFKGDFFVIVSLAVQALLFSALYNWVSADASIGTMRNLTNGPFGITGIPHPSLFGWKLSGIGAMAAFSTAICALSGGFFGLLKHSPWGRLLKSVRDDELAARGLGKSSRLVKMQAFAIACAFAALAGSLYAAYVRYIDPSSASLDESILMLCMVLVGGVGNLRGPFVGALVLIGIPEALRFAQLPDAIAANVRLLIYGAALIVMMRVRPQGLAGEYRLR